jgi:hypothetical protein
MITTKPKPNKDAVAVSSIDALRSLPAEVKEATFGERWFRRHVNKNGTLGGFVESTAKATEFVIISSGSLVLENAVVCNAARLDDATVSGDARVYECARLSDGIAINGKTEVFSDTSYCTIIRENGVCRVVQRQL